MVTSECEPFAKSGGLADVVDALARALGDLGHDVDVYLPRYRDLRPPAPAKRSLLTVPLPAPPDAPGARSGAIMEAVEVLTAGADGYRLRLVDHAPSFDRAGYYGEAGADYPDNGARFALLGRAALETIRAEGGGVAVLHGHDWQAGPAVLLRDFAWGSDPGARRHGDGGHMPQPCLPRLGAARARAGARPAGPRRQGRRRRPAAGGGRAGRHGQHREPELRG